MLYLAGMIVKAVTPKPHGDLVNGSSELSMSPSENSLLLQYKDLIREQDHKLQELTQTIGRLTVDKSTLQVRHPQLLNLLYKFRSLDRHQAILHKKFKIFKCYTRCTHAYAEPSQHIEKTHGCYIVIKNFNLL